LPVYWGDQPIVAAPAYIGAVIIFLGLMALFLVQGRLKWWIVSAFLLSLLLSWGRNFEVLTQFFIDYVPLYSKFRAVSSIQVIIEMIMPILAIVGLHQIFNAFTPSEEKMKALTRSALILGGITLVFILFGGQLFEFGSLYDAQVREGLGNQVVEALREDRTTILRADAIRSLIFLLMAAGLIWAYIREKLKQNWVIVALAVVILIDLVGVDRRYVNNDDFVNARVMEQPFQKNGADLQILQDEGHYRVYDATTDAFNFGGTSFYHNSVGGYHAAKPQRMQDLNEFYLSKGDVGILNMLNVKYIITRSKDGGPVAQRNPYNNGNAWFVDSAILAENADEEILLLDSLNTKRTAVIHREFADLLPVEEITRDSTAVIELTEHSPQRLVYEAKTNSPQLALFSEMYYPYGWKVSIDGQVAEHFRANYALRAMTVPTGTHQIVFEFKPEVITAGSTVALVSSIIFLLLLIGGIGSRMRSETASEESS
jgi:hypothetical protein